MHNVTLVLCRNIFQSMVKYFQQTILQQNPAAFTALYVSIPSHYTANFQLSNADKTTPMSAIIVEKKIRVGHNYCS